DPMVDCKQTNNRYRADHLVVLSPKTPGQTRVYAAYLEADERGRAKALDKLGKVLQRSLSGDDVDELRLDDISEHGIGTVIGPDASKPGTLTEPRMFNLMFQTYLGPIQSDEAKVYLRPETAQGIFVNFNNVIDSTRVKVPFGIAQQGKSFRNEVTTRHFTFRTCEFEQMEMEFFCKPGTDADWFTYWKEERMRWFVSLGVRPERLRLRPHESDELAHYSTACADIEYEFPFGWSELEGIACRTDYDLKKHAEFSGKKLEWIDQQSGERYVPFVVEPALGTDRALLTVLVDAYREEEVDGNPRTVLKLHPRLAPTKVAVFPLLRKDGHPEKAQEIYRQVRELYPAAYDEQGNIGRRYRRQDEAGTPACVTVDHQTLEDNTVTLRDRDTLEQHRVPVAELPTILRERFGF
ncbi:MAG: glycine--tRNA ligase, partial [Bdellovibrionales bacterium]|nr:glycine--tRNA ligase [Bdellovibrionales bacterium]